MPARAYRRSAITLTHVLLFFHLLGAFCFFAGGAVVGVLQIAAIRRERPSEIHAYLRLAPFGAALVGVGALLTLGFGIALVQHEGVGFSPAWIQAALGLWVAAMAVGGYGGRTARHARHLAEKLAAEGDAPSPELRALVSARGPLYASYASFLMLLAIVVLMVWQPGGGGSSAAVPSWLRTDIVSSYPRLAYLPTRVPAGYALSGEMTPHDGYSLEFTQQGNFATQLTFSVQRLGNCSKQPIGAQERFRLNGDVVPLHYGEDGEQAWLCRDGVLIEAADVPGLASDKIGLELANLVAYAQRTD